MTKTIALLISLLSFASQALAATSPEALSLGDIANAATAGPLHLIAHVLYLVCYAAGGMLIVSSLVQYKAHRDNSLQVPISRPITLLIFGIILILLPIILDHVAPGALVVHGMS